MTDTPKLPITAAELMALRDELHGNAVSRGWWSNLTTGERVERNFGEMLMLSLTELGEAWEGVVLELPDDKLPHRTMFEVELGDFAIRQLDMSGGFDLDVGAHFETAYRVVSGFFVPTQDVARHLWNISCFQFHAMEAYRTSDMDLAAKWVSWTIVSTLIVAQHLKLDVLGAIREKAEFNKVRADHDPANRARDGGKKV